MDRRTVIPAQRRDAFDVSKSWPYPPTHQGQSAPPGRSKSCTAAPNRIHNRHIHPQNRKKDCRHTLPAGQSFSTYSRASRLVPRMPTVCPLSANRLPSHASVLMKSPSASA